MREIVKWNIVKWNEEKNYFEIVKEPWRERETRSWGMKAEDGTIVIPKDYYTDEEIRMAEWLLCVSINKQFKVIERTAGIITWNDLTGTSWTIVKRI